MHNKMNTYRLRMYIESKKYLEIPDGSNANVRFICEAMEIDCLFLFSFPNIFQFIFACPCPALMYYEV